VVVVEAEAAVGGRVRSVTFGGVTVEEGANWVHRSVMSKPHMAPVHCTALHARGQQGLKANDTNEQEYTYNPIEDLVKVAGRHS
jgi:protoporphyrinogen oxidase